MKTPNVWQEQDLEKVAAVVRLSAAAHFLTLALARLHSVHASTVTCPAILRRRDPASLVLRPCPLPPPLVPPLVPPALAAPLAPELRPLGCLFGDDPDDWSFCEYGAIARKSDIGSSPMGIAYSRKMCTSFGFSEPVAKW